MYDTVGSTLSHVSLFENDPLEVTNPQKLCFRPWLNNSGLVRASSEPAWNSLHDYVIRKTLAFFEDTSNNEEMPQNMLVSESYVKVNSITSVSEN